MTWLAVATGALWIGLGGYLFFLHGRQRALDARLHRLESDHDE